MTIVDTKEYYEDTPCILRLMAGNDADHLWKNITIPFADIIRDAKNAEFICGTAAAVRKDHVLVGTTNGVASRVVPFEVRAPPYARCTARPWPRRRATPS